MRYLKVVNQIIPASSVLKMLAECITETQLEAIAIKQTKLEKFKIKSWGDKLEQYFLPCKPELDKVVYSMFRTDNAEVAQELFCRIENSESTFYDCAKQFSQATEAQTGGLIGPVAISQPHPVSAQKLSTSKPGKVLSPIKLENWYVILRLEKFISAQLDETTQGMLLSRLWYLGSIRNIIITFLIYV
jgi:parvulin-like peptidyl-prolyl isomerase